MPREGLRYTSEHEWVRQDPDGSVTIGITDYAAEALGDIVFVSLPTVGDSLAAGQVMGEVESTKSVSEVYAPVGGQVVARNDALDGQPDLINTDPFGDGWIVTLQPGERASLDDLLDAEAYAALTH